MKTTEAPSASPREFNVRDDLSDNPRLAEVVERLARQAPAEAVILFGSRARGSFRSDSDIDLCVVIPATINPSLNHAGRLWSDVADMGLPVDIITRRAKDLRANKHNVNSLAFDLAREGKLVFGVIEDFFHR